jgi:hypothetical protein
LASLLTLLSWYFYSSARYEHKVFSGLGLTLRCNHRDEYPKATFRGCWKGSSRRWFHVDMADAPQWPNEHLLSPLIKDKQKALEESPRLKALVNLMAELHRARLEACHCIKEFILRRIRPLGRKEKMAFECPRFADPSRNPSSGKTLSFIYPF